MKTILIKGLYLLWGCLYCMTLTGQGSVVANLAPEDLAEIQTETMGKELELNSQQKEKVKEINLKYAKLLKVAENEKSGLQNPINSKLSEFQNVLTPEQYQKWLERRKYWMDMIRNNYITMPFLGGEQSLE